MKLTFKGKEYEVKFGIRFIKNLDEIYFVERDGIKFGAGLDIASATLIAKQIGPLTEILFAGTKGLTMTEIEEYVEGVAEEGKLDELFEEVGKQFETAPIIKDQFKLIQNEMKKA